MKIAVLSFSGNVGKSTVARHLLAPRIRDAEVLAVESINAGEDERGALRGRQFSELQNYLQVVDHAVIVDIGASNVEELLSLMGEYCGSHEDFDFFVVPTVPALKQQQDTIATLAELASLGVPPERIRIVFNQVERGSEVTQAFHVVLAFLEASPVARASVRCRIGVNEIYARVKGLRTGIANLAADTTDYKAQLRKASGPAERLAVAERLACRRLAIGVLPQLDACFAALELGTAAYAEAPAGSTT